MATHDYAQSKRVSYSHLGQEYQPLESPQLDNPYPFYARARREEPIFFSEGLQAWVVTRYDDVKAILSQPEIFSSKETLRPVVAFTPEVLQVLTTGYGFVPTITNTDGNEHLRFRVPLNQAFLPARLKSMEGQISAVANRLIDGFSRDNKADLVAQFAVPLPLEIILALFGIPQTDMDQCKRWSDEAHALTASPLPPERQFACAQSFVALQHYLADLVEQRRRAPGDDVVSCLLTIRPEGARPLEMAEMVVTLLGVLLAGHETTTNLIGTALYLLLSQPECWQHLCAHPEAIPSAVEEVLRFDAPVQTFYRTALREAQVGDTTIPAEALLLLAYGSANRDEAQFSHPDQFDLFRSPNRHLAFGYGAHFCVGAPLARLEGRIALEVLSQRLPQLRLQPHQTLSYVPNLMFRGLKRLAVEWNANFT
jgi:cytochrome P450